MHSQEWLCYRWHRHSCLCVFASSGNVETQAPGFSPAKPFTREHVSDRVRAKLRDDSGARLIEPRGIDFAPSEDFCQILMATGDEQTGIDIVTRALEGHQRLIAANAGHEDAMVMEKVRNNNNAHKGGFYFPEPRDREGYISG